MRNRSAPSASVTPVLSYPDVAAAVEWLTHTFGFVEHVRIGDHRARLGFGDGALIVADESQGRGARASDGVTHSVMVRIDDVDDHYQRVSAAGAHVISTPETHMYGERLTLLAVGGVGRCGHCQGEAIPAVAEKPGMSFFSRCLSCPVGA
jgi:uncharacterized glyoxalase superfamily protein PhnB